ncbi:thermonuclease family protein [Magnetospirillum sp. UT-4]|uniref:thermonuclease family protein n=1 Tax=Magnetospirillum sp. UT-4 TaxID=2681467 RepID=UPI001382D806|nr:thermonuclease family protein [Magnetospirillum sp. UT-4]CAA7619246.1 Nuclease (SNase) [Magnetospirillum sp. UT-4]
MRRPATMTWIIYFHAAIVALSPIFSVVSMASPNGEVGEIARIIDGDTFVVRHAGAPNGEPMRAMHMDTPEKGDRARCQAERTLARRASDLARRLLPPGSRVRLQPAGRDRYGRLLAAITLADGRDLARVMIASGLARPYEGGRKSDWCRP